MRLTLPLWGCGAWKSGPSSPAGPYTHDMDPSIPAQPQGSSCQPEMTASPSPSRKSGAWLRFLLPHPPRGQRFSPQDPQTRAAASSDRHADSQAPPRTWSGSPGRFKKLYFLSRLAQMEVYSEAKSNTDWLPYSPVGRGLTRVAWVKAKVPSLGTSLAVQWVGRSFHCRGLGFHPWSGNQDPKSHAV